MSRLALALALLGGCYGPETFQDDVDDAVCEWSLTCFGAPATTLGDYGYCDDGRAQETPDFTGSCSFDDPAARACVRGIRNMPCQSEGQPPPMPEACDAVWSCG